MVEFNIVLVASRTALLTVPTYALSSEKTPAILANVDSPNIHALETDEINSMRGQYFSSYQAAVSYCARVNAGCIGPIERVRSVSRPPRWEYPSGGFGSWRVKTAWGRYLKY